MSEVIEMVELRASSPKTALPGLDEAQRKLLALQGTLDGINARLSGLSTHSIFKRTAATITDTIRELETKVGKGATLKDISQVLGFDPKDVRERLVREQERMTNALAESQRKRASLSGAANAAARAELLSNEKKIQAELTALQRTFTGPQRRATSAPSAAAFFHGYQQAAVKEAKEPIAMLQALFGKGGTTLPASPLIGGVATPTAGGPIHLTIPPSQIIATLGPGTVHLTVPPGTVSGGGGTGSGGGGSAAAATPTPPPGGNVTQIRTQQPSGKQRIRSEAGHVTTESFSGSNKQIITEDLKAKAKEDLLSALEKVRADYQKQVKSILGKSTGEDRSSQLAAAGKQAAVQAAALNTGFAPLPKRTVQSITGQFGKNVAKDAAKMADDLQSQAIESFQRVAQLRKELGAAKQKGDRDEQLRIRREIGDENKRNAQLQKFYATGDRATAAIDKVRERTAAVDEAQRRKRVVQQQQQAYRAATYGAANQAITEFQAAGGKVISQTAPYKGAPGRVVLEREEAGMKHTLTASFGKTGAEANLTTRALKATREELGLLGGDFIRNTAKVAAWSASVAVLYKTVGLATDALRTLSEIGAQMARLDQVFDKVGGSTRELTADVLHLSAAYGRGSQETMEATIQWARVLTSRAQINEAVRVSLMAANVAELTVAEATQNLTSIMQAYGLEVGGLNTVLGELNQISNTYNVTNAAMFEGISRTVGVARAAKLPLAELMALIAAPVGTTGQTGANFGNAIKSAITALGNPALQEKLREQFKFEVTTGGGEDLKGMSEVLGELFVRYEKLNEAQQRSLVFQVAGKTQSSRLTAILDNYVRAQVLAINAQLNLNSAETENERIVAALKAQMQGLVTEWDRFVVVQGANGPAQALGQIATALRNVLALMNSPAGSALTTLFTGLAAASAAKVALTAMTAKQGVARGFAGRSMDNVVGAAIALNNTANAAAMTFIQRRNPPVPYSIHTAGSIQTGGTVGVTRPMMLPSTAQMGLLDKLVLKTNVWGESALRVAKNADVGSVAVRGMFGAFGVGMKAVSLATMALSEFLLPLAVITLGVVAFNKGMEAIGLSSRAAESRLAGFNKEAERAAAAAAAFGETADLFKTVAQAFSPEKGFQSMRPEDQVKLLKQSSEVVGLNEPDLAKREKLQEGYRNVTLALQAQGRFAQIVNIAEAERNILITQRREQLQQEFEAIKKRERENERELNRLKAADQGPLGWIGRQTRQQRISEFERQKSEAGGAKTRNLLEQTNAFEEQSQSTERFKTAMEKQKVLVESIGEVFSSIQTSNPLERAMVRLASLEAQLYSNKLRVQELDAEDERNLAGQAERRKAVADIDQKILEARDEIGKLDAEGGMMKDKAVKSPVISGFKELGQAAFTGTSSNLERLIEIRKERERLMAEISRLDEQKNLAGSGRLPGMDLNFMQSQAQREKLDEENKRLSREQRAIEASRRATEEATRFQSGQRQSGFISAANNFGVDQSDKMLRQQEALARDADALERKGNLTFEERGRLFDDLHGQQVALLDLARRRVDVEAEIKQLAIDQNKEFARSLMGAGPTELLRKLAAFRLSFDKRGKRRPEMDLGGFFSMSPAMRQDYAQLNPQFDPHMNELLREKNRLDKTIGSVDLDKALLGISQKIGKWALDMSKPAAEFANAMTAMKDAVSGATDKLAAMTGAAQEFINYVATLKQPALASGQMSFGPFNPQSGGVGAGAGRMR